jgi:hypothetical protein
MKESNLYGRGRYGGLIAGVIGFAAPVWFRLSRSVRTANPAYVRHAGGERAASISGAEARRHSERQ